MNTRMVLMLAIFSGSSTIFVTGNTVNGEATRRVSGVGDHQVSWYTVDSGGQTFSSSGVFELAGTVGQSDTATMSGGPFEIKGGFWAGIETCPADTNGDGSVGMVDLLAVIADWGPCSGCSTDIDGNGAADLVDLLAVIAAWGPCE